MRRANRRAYLALIVIAAVCWVGLHGGLKGLQHATLTSAPGVPTAGPSSPGEMTVARFLIKKGATKATAAGVAGTVAGESSGNPESVGTGGAGLIGWTPPSSAYPVQQIVTGNIRRDMGVQLTDMLAYIEHNGSIADLNSYGTGGLQSAMTVAWRFSAHYERPKVTGSDIRPSVVAGIYARLTAHKHSHRKARR